MSRRQLPIGIQDFRTIREQDCYYVDKTSLIHRLVSEGRYYFLSRPRRFGRSLPGGWGRTISMDNEWRDSPFDRLPRDSNVSPSRSEAVA